MNHACSRSRTIAVAFIATWLGACHGQIGDDPEADEVDGTLEILAIDEGEGEAATSTERYDLVTPEGARYELVFGEQPDLQPGVRLRVRGKLDAGAEGAAQDPRLLVGSFDVVVPAPPAVEVTRSHLVGGAMRPPYRVATLLVHWGQPDGMTVASMRERLFTGASSTNVYLREASYGMVGIAGDVFGWYQIDPPSGCDTRAIGDRARAAAQASGVNLAGYQQVMYYFPRLSSCGWSGLAYIGSPARPARDSWYNGSAGCVVLAHELGHNYGAMHARACSNLPAGGVCAQFSEYGDPFCVMGSGCWHMSAVQKGQQGWFGKCNVVTARASGAFEVLPTELSSNGLQALRIPRGGDRYYYVENRMPLGKIDAANGGAAANAAFAGILIHDGPEIQPMPPSRQRNPYLIDATPNTPNFRDGPLAVGQRFRGPEGIEIALEAKTNGVARVRVTIPGGSGAATCLDGTSFPGNGGAIPATAD